MISKLCQLIVTDSVSNQIIYIETALKEVIINQLQDGHSYNVQCEILQFNSQEDCDNMVGLISILNEECLVPYISDIRITSHNDLIQKEGLENLQ